MEVDYDRQRTISSYFLVLQLGWIEHFVAKASLLLPGLMLQANTIVLSMRLGICIRVTIYVCMHEQ